MSKFRKGEGAKGDRSAILDHLWHYGGELSYRELDDDRGGLFSGLFGRPRTYFERSHDKFTQFMSAGGVKFEDVSEKNKERPYLRKARVVRWLVVVAAVWTVFRFVSL